MREFQTKERKYFIDFLPNSIFNSFTINERSNYSKYRDRHRKYHKGLNELDELKNKIEELRVQLKLKGNDIKSHEKDLQTYYDGVKHLDKKIDFNAWVETEWRNKKKCLDDNSLKPNWRVSVIVEFKLRGSRIRKRFYCGNWKKTKQTLDKHIGKEEHFISKEEEDIRWILQDYIESFSRWFIYHNGFQKYEEEKLNLTSAIDWFNEYEKKNGKGKGFEWSSILNKHHFSIVQ